MSQNGTMTLRPTMLKNAVVRLEKRAHRAAGAREVRERELK